MLTKIGRVTGWGGIIWALTHLGTLWDEPVLVEEAKALVDLLLPLIDQDENYDVMESIRLHRGSRRPAPPGDLRTTCGRPRFGAATDW